MIALLVCSRKWPLAVIAMQEALQGIGFERQILVMEIFSVSTLILDMETNIYIIEISGTIIWSKNTINIFNSRIFHAIIYTMPSC